MKIISFVVHYKTFKPTINDFSQLIELKMDNPYFFAPLVFIIFFHLG